jgi:hypothetical protein
MDMEKVLEFILAGRHISVPPDLPDGAELANPPLVTEPNEIIKIELPRDSEILSAHFNNVGQLMLAVLGDEDSRTEARHFVILKTGEGPPERIKVRENNLRARGVHRFSIQPDKTASSLHVFEMVPY